MRERIDRRWVAAGLLIALLLAGPLFLHQSDYRLAVVTSGFFYAILAASWALLAGLAGQFSFAHMALVGVGAYTAAFLGRDLGTSPLAGIVIGTLMAGLVGLIIGILCLRLRTAYLALFTIAFSEILRIVLVTEFQYTEGSNGVQLAPLYPGITAVAEYYIMVALLIGAMVAMYSLAGSRFGLFIRAMREDEEAAAAMGVNVVRYKVLVFVITSLIVGLSGAIFYHQVGIITPNVLLLLQMALIIAFAIIGGVESLLGAALGAFVSFVTLEALREINILGLHIELGAWRYAAFGLLLIFTLRFAQNGLLYPIIHRFMRRRAGEEAVAKRKQAAEVGP
ncbi:MAG: branched-chain amino acid ABC transporter permease [Ardenticatenaceae bacterium]|nr:branched-chain amino acid ABC transporter permease [Ardenticatenaceae bacterium]HBY98961.1 branched-chain amino acid ABC transporter permease [Chloroflexota bacterium]